MGYPKPLGFDPARESLPENPQAMHRNTVGKRVDLPPEAFAGACARYLLLHCHTSY